MNSAQNNTDNPRRPFQGLRSFEEKNKSEFGGRDTEIKELLGLVEDLGLTVVFGKSGIGKTSVLQAGLMPALRKKFYYPTYIRIDYSSSKSPLRQVKDLLFESLVAMDPSIPPMGSVSLWEYMHDLDFMKGLITPVLILDQFEEIFTLGEKNSGVKELVAELADLVENRIPTSTKEKYRAQGKIVPSRYSKLSYRVVLSLREDYLARLEELKKYMPSIMDNRLRVVQMTISQAMDAAMKPAKDLISKSVAEDIIKILPGVSQTDFDLLKQKGEEDQKLKVEPFLLSLICDRINEKRIEKGLDVITSELVSEFNVSDVISSFYNESTSKYGQHVEHAIEDLLLTEGGFRKLQALEEMKRKYDISDQVIDELVSARIIRKEARDGVAYVELIHDVLAPVIKHKRDTRLEKEKELARLEAIKMERAKNRKRMKRIGSIMGGLLLLFIGIVAFQTNRVHKIQEENKRKARARELIISALSESIYYDDRSNSGLLSKLAYGIYNQDRNDEITGIIESDWRFYRIMMRSSFNYKNSPNDEIHKFHEIIKPIKVEDNSEEANNLSSLSRKKKTLRATALTPTVQGNDYGYLVALRDNTIRKLSLDSKSINIEKDPMFKYLNEGKEEERVSSMAFHFDKKLLALARKRTIYLYNENLNQHYLDIQIPDTTTFKYRDSYEMKFMPNGSIVLALGENLYRWDTTYRVPVQWAKMDRFKWEINDKTLKIGATLEIEDIDKKPIQNTSKNKTEGTTTTKDLKPKKDLLSKTKKPVKRLRGSKSKDLKIEYTNNSISFSANEIRTLAVSKDGLIALALKDELIIIDEVQNKIHEITFKEWRDRGITAVGFDPNGKFLLLGDGRGGIFKIDTPSNREFHGVEVKKHFAHSQKVTDIAFSTNKNSGQNKNNPQLLATASQDGSVAIWNTNNWSALSLDSALFGFSKKPARKISFSKGGGYLIVAYDNAHIIRWPTSLSKIEKLICESHGKAEINPITKDKYEIVASEIENNCCDCNKKE